MNKKEHLIEALNRDWDRFKLIIDNDEMDGFEEIEFIYKDFDYKSNYINKTYDDNLVLKSNKNIKIVGYECSLINFFD
jgi:hypothetical protein